MSTRRADAGTPAIDSDRCEIIAPLPDPPLRVDALLGSRGVVQDFVPEDAKSASISPQDSIDRTLSTLMEQMPRVPWFTRPRQRAGFLLYLYYMRGRTQDVIVL